MSGSAGGGEETTSRKADTAPRRRPNQPRTTGLIARAMSARDCPLHRCSRQRLILRRIAFAASSATAGQKLTK
jgi:hypothetical protein